MPEDLYRRAAAELASSCGAVCLDALHEFNVKFAGEDLDVARLATEVSGGSVNKAPSSKVALVKFGNQTSEILQKVCFFLES